MTLSLLASLESPTGGAPAAPPARPRHGGRWLVLAATLALACFGCGSVASRKDAGGSGGTGGSGGAGAPDSGQQAAGGSGGSNGDGGPPIDAGAPDARTVLRSGGLGATGRPATATASVPSLRLGEGHVSLAYPRVCGSQLCLTGGLRP
jgi:hypothetical protein